VSTAPPGDEADEARERPASFAPHLAAYPEEIVSDSSTYNSEAVRCALIRVGERVRDQVLKELRRQSTDALSEVAFESQADKIYVIDHVVEDVLLAALAEELQPALSFALICEGVNDEQPLAFPAGLAVEQCPARVIVDPIDGTRSIMHNKRSAWLLAGVAPNRGAATMLSDIDLAVQVEIPTTRAALADVLWARRGGGARGETLNLITGERAAFQPRPSQAATICGGFAMLVHFFPGGKEILAAIEEELVIELTGGLEGNKTALFDDQYMSTGGQLYELMVGRDRMIADVRSLLYDRFRREGRPVGHSCHPYDACAALIAQEAGVIITDGRGQPFDAPLDTTTDLSWIGYANPAIRAEVEETLLRLLARHGLR
jgi:fructose-1,6-bisphosphatase/inositol monophosphatase family enzyme